MNHEQPFDLDRFVTAQEGVYPKALAAHSGRSATEILGYPDDLKVRSSMTLFGLATDDVQPFRAVLDAFYDGQDDPATLDLLG